MLSGIIPGVMPGCVMKEFAMVQLGVSEDNNFVLGGLL
jgi:hypothetical protein